MVSGLNYLEVWYLLFVIDPLAGAEGKVTEGLVMKRSNPRQRLLGALLVVMSLPLVAAAQNDPTCCVNRVGDVNGLNGDEPTLGDIMFLVSRLFIDPTLPLPCLAEADVNQSGGISPVFGDITLGDVMVLVDYLFITGQSAGLADCLVQSGEPYGYAVSTGSCKGSSAVPVAPSTAGLTCILYNYDGEGTLSLTHQNAGLNCCPVPTLTVKIEDNTVTITETDDGLCDCSCLYDIVYRVENLPAGEYRIIVNEAISGGGDPLDFIVDLAQRSSGLFCVGRSQYPWSGEAAGIVTGHSGCKSHGGAALASALSADLTCISYEYDGSSVLTLNHGNAAFNCCPAQLLADFAFDGNTITITEREVLDQGGCLCLCLFDLDLQILNLPPGQYHVVVVEPYLGGGDQPLDFMLDLGGATSGSHCVERTQYPWGALELASGSLISRSTCKSSGGAALVDSVSSNQSCIIYEYDGVGALSITHVNAGFNCCPTEISARFDFDDQIIRVHEVEDLSGGGCRCLCLFDLQFDVENVPPGVYLVEFVESYLDEGDPPLTATLDLTGATSGSHCEERTQYPWGM